MIDHHETDVRVAEYDRDTRLIVYLESAAAEWQRKAGEAALDGCRARAGDCREYAKIATAGAARRRERMVAASGLTERDVAAPPPAQPAPSEPINECVLPGCRCVESVVERPGYRIHLPAASAARRPWWRRRVAALLLWLLMRVQP